VDCNSRKVSRSRQAPPGAGPGVEAKEAPSTRASALCSA
jgi:hypothetical protein